MNSEHARRLFRLSTSKSATSSLPSIHASRPGSSDSSTDSSTPGTSTMPSEEDIVSSNHLPPAETHPEPVPAPVKTPRQDVRSRCSSIATSTISDASPALPVLPHERIVTSGNGIIVSIGLTEPILFLEGFDRNASDSKTTMLRGSLHLRITKSTKIRKVVMIFRGVSHTFWPNGLRKKKGPQTCEDKIFCQVRPFFNAQFETAEHSYGADHVQLSKSGRKRTMDSIYSPANLFAPAVDGLGRSDSLVPLPRDVKRLSLQHTPSRSLGKGDFTGFASSVAQRGYKIFPPGDYMYDFEIPIDSRMPETIKTESGWVRYQLEVSVERAGAFRPNLFGIKEIPFIRTPNESSLEHVEPIAISRTWEDQLHYDIIISGKSFPLGSKVPIAFKLTPLSKVACHRIKVYVTEQITVHTPKKNPAEPGKEEDRVKRSEGLKQLLLFEKRANATSSSTFPGSSMRITAGGGVDWEHRAAAARGEEYVNPRRTCLLGDLDNDYITGPTEMEFDVQLPSCPMMKERDPSERLHCDTMYENIEVAHWIKIVLRLSKPDPSNPAKRRHFEISIDSPFHIMSCMASQSNIYLPSYNSPSSFYNDEYECGCPGATQLEQDESFQQQQPTFVAEEFTPPPPFPSDAPHYSPPPTHPSRSFTNGSGGLDRPATAHLPASHSINNSNNNNANRNINGGSNGNERPGRPMHLIRIPSFGPPPFEDVPPPPPPLMTPPPDYATLRHGEGQSDRFRDYFERAHIMEQQYDENSRGRSRVDVPLTPGGRVHRSMDVPREWLASALSAESNR